MNSVIPTFSLAAFAVSSLAAFAQSTAFPQGTYISREALDALGVSRHSGVEVTFAEGRYEMRRDAELRVLGRYQQAGSQITITDAEGAWACTSPAMASATYSWRLEGSDLVLTPTGQDSCNRRRNRLAGIVLVRGRAPAPPDTVSAPRELRESWERFWIHSDSGSWVDAVFDANAIAEDGNRRLVGIEQIRQWLGGQDSRSPKSFPFQFTLDGTRIVERGRYRDIFGSPDGTTRILVGRYQLTWTRAGDSKWKVTEWILR